MAKNTQPIAKRCKALGISPAVMGYAKKTTNRNPGGNNFRKKKSEYATQLQEKQKLKFIYGILEKQFAAYFDIASRQQGITGENLLRLLALHCERQEGQHSQLPDQGWRCDRSS